jgi:hypothetical protein
VRTNVKPVKSSRPRRGGVPRPVGGTVAPVLALFLVDPGGERDGSASSPSAGHPFAGRHRAGASWTSSFGQARAGRRAAVGELPGRIYIAQFPGLARGTEQPFVLPGPLGRQSAPGEPGSYGGGIYDFSGTVPLNGSTVSGNTPDNCDRPALCPAARGTQRGARSASRGPRQQVGAARDWASELHHTIERYRPCSCPS